jgi:hypothetical protein
MLNGNDRRQPQARPAPQVQPDPKRLRRSSRLMIEIPVEVICKGPQNSVRTEETRTMVVSAHGCAVSLETSMQPGDKVVVIHKMSREEIVCSVVMCRQARTGNWETGLEFQGASPNFWHIAFPPDDWDPALRDQNVPVKVNK